MFYKIYYYNHNIYDSGRVPETAVSILDPLHFYFAHRRVEHSFSLAKFPGRSMTEKRDFSLSNHKLIDLKNCDFDNLAS